MNYSSLDMVGFVAMTQRKLVGTVGTYIKRQRQPPPITEAMRHKLISVREVHHRFAKGIYTHTDIEAGNVVDAANWCLELHALLNGNTPRQLDIDKRTFEVRNKSERPHSASYQEALSKAIFEW